MCVCILYILTGVAPQTFYEVQTRIIYLVLLIKEKEVSEEVTDSQ